METNRGQRKGSNRKQTEQSGRTRSDGNSSIIKKMIQSTDKGKESNQRENGLIQKERFQPNVSTAMTVIDRQFERRCEKKSEFNESVHLDICRATESSNVVTMEF
jgi:hypothetical protein